MKAGLSVAIVLIWISMSAVDANTDEMCSKSSHLKGNFKHFSFKQSQPVLPLTCIEALLS